MKCLVALNAYKIFWHMGKSLEFFEFLTYAEFYIPPHSIEQDVELENVIWLYKFRDMAQTDFFVRDHEL